MPRVYAGILRNDDAIRFHPMIATLPTRDPSPAFLRRASQLQHTPARCVHAQWRTAVVWIALEAGRRR